VSNVPFSLEILHSITVYSIDSRYLDFLGSGKFPFPLGDVCGAARYSSPWCQSGAYVIVEPTRIFILLDIKNGRFPWDLIQ